MSQQAGEVALLPDSAHEGDDQLPLIAEALRLR
jgi:hypothetical protein